MEVEEGAVLEADVIEADSGRIGSVVKGKITGDVVNLQGPSSIFMLRLKSLAAT